MKKLGLIGGTSWVSTIDYYRFINEEVNKRLGGMNFSELMIYSFNYADIIRNNNNNDWAKTLDMITGACLGFQKNGAKGIVLCANTMHLIADDLQKRIEMPIIHIADATAEAIKKQRLNKVALLGTKFTMERDFYHNRLRAHGIEAIIPNDADRDYIHGTIFGELGSGILKHETREKYVSIINGLVKQGAQGIILGCTEIPPLVKPEHVHVPLFDTGYLHSMAAVDFALG